MANFGDAAAGISMTIELFNICIDSLRIISRARHSGESLVDFAIRLDLEIARLVLWGRNTGLDRDKLDPSLEPVKPLLVKILSAISSSVQDADQLRTAYGLHVVEDLEAETSGSPPPAQSPSPKRLDILSLPQVSAGIQRQRLMSFQLKKRTNLYKKSKWAIWDEEKANRFVEAVRGFVDGLNKLLTESQKADFDAETTALRIAILGTNWPQPARTFNVIENAMAGRYESLALPARLSRLRLEMEMEEIAPSISTREQPLTPPLSIQHDQLQPLGAYRSVGKYRGTDILVEWRTLKTSETAGEKGRARKKQAAKLASIFQELKSHPAEYRVLECIGYINQLDHVPARLGTVFQVPQAPADTTTRKAFHSLNEYLSSQRFDDY